MNRRTHARLVLAALAVCCATLAAPRALHADDDTGAIPPEVESAVDRGLEWLAKAQQRDGSWNGGGTASAASTGLAAMAFMARGHVPGQGPYGENINRAIDALLAMQAPDGIIVESAQSQPMYDHGICTVALCEAYGMLDDRRQPLVRTAISKAVARILAAQRIAKNENDQGGWRYTPTSVDSDTSVSGWQLMALRGASNAGAAIPETAIANGINYIQRRATAGGGFAYGPSRGGGDSADSALTGTGVLALSLMGKSNTREVIAGGDYLLRNISNDLRHSYYFYTVYYCSQAAWQLGGNYWPILNKTISADLRRKQGADGSWSGEINESYCTSMAILALTVPYRYLPIYQR